MNWLFGQELVIVLLGIVLLFILGAAWSATGRKELLYGFGLALVFTVLGVIIERVVVTDREAIERTLLQIARDVQSNNRTAVVGHVYSGATELKAKAQAELSKYHFTECRVTKIHLIDIDAKANPRSALVEFNVIASGTFRADSIEVTDTVPRWVRLHMLRENDGRWTVQSYEHAPPQQMLLDKPLEQ